MLPRLGIAMTGIGIVWLVHARTGSYAALFFCAKVAEPHAHPADPRLELARKEAARLIAELHASERRPGGSCPD
ncbi:hypothetical protein [Streptomyces sp. NPDC060366]|uniref:hypothetical protein n=1 Tax=Streptomyces sp. NPDC060366 TaxID=3347105 RepID=UPI003653D4D6